MKVYVLKDCVTSSKDFLEAKSIVDLNKTKEEKLFNLGLVEEFSAEKHGTLKKSNVLEMKIEALEAKVAELEEGSKILAEEKEALEAKVAELEDRSKATKTTTKKA